MGYGNTIAMDLYLTVWGFALLLRQLFPDVTFYWRKEDCCYANIFGIDNLLSLGFADTALALSLSSSCK